MIGIYYLDEQLLFISFNQIIPPVSEIGAQNGHKDVVEFIFGEGSDIHHKESNSWAALMIGIYYLD